MTTPCPTPAKARFATTQAAQIAAARYTKNLRTYQCPCDWWHLTSKPAPEQPTPDTHTTAHVTALDNTDFELLAGAELRGQATPQQAAALRDPINIERWITALANINNDIQRQLASHARDHTPEVAQWRVRILRIQQSLRERRVEAKKIRQDMYAAAGHERALLARAGLSVKEVRAIAGDRAISRLINAHHQEFGDLLAEEFAKDGLTLPTRLARHAARRLATTTPNGANDTPQEQQK